MEIAANLRNDTIEEDFKAPVSRLLFLIIAWCKQVPPNLDSIQLGGQNGRQ